MIKNALDFLMGFLMILIGMWFIATSFKYAFAPQLFHLTMGVTSLLIAIYFLHSKED